MLPVVHPLTKTATDLRRAINRLHIFKEQNPSDEEVANGNIDEIIEKLKEANRLIPKSMLEADNPNAG